MRRAPIVLVVTAAGLTGLAVYKTRPAASHIVGPSLSLPAGSTGSAAGTSTSTPTSTSPSTSTSAPKARTTPSQTTPTTLPTTTGVPPTTTAPKATTTTTPATTTRAATGDVVDYNYGALSVSVTVSGHTISKVGIATLNDGGNFRSQSIDQQSIPILEQETLQAQSANIQSVSGASYTSQGFAQSLQSALAKLGF
jgi:uncharacterized protein with FMN-binding domain